MEVLNSPGTAGIIVFVSIGSKKQSQIDKLQRPIALEKYVRRYIC